MAAIIERLQAAMQACQGQEALGSQAESAAEADGRGQPDDAAAAELDESAAAVGEESAAQAELASSPGQHEDDPAGGLHRALNRDALLASKMSQSSHSVCATSC